jgi:hypothetical protein
MSVQLVIQRNIAPNTLWHWAVLMTNGHVFSVSNVSFETAVDAVVDAANDGVIVLKQAEEADGNAAGLSQPIKTGKAWSRIEWGDECPKCGDEVEILTDVPDGLACDGDEARCVSCGCKGVVAVADTDSAWVNWDCEQEAM